MSLTPINPDDYSRAIVELQGKSPVASKRMLGLVGEKSNGGLVFFPGSLEKGYRDYLLPVAQRPHYTLNLGIIGQLSDGSLVFPPSYDEGRNQGSNDMKFAILAEGERRLLRQQQEQQQRFELSQLSMKSEFERERESMQSTIRQLQEEVDRIKSENQSS